MKKITEFIVDKRYFVIVTFILLAGLSLFLGSKVNINDDFSKYLPSDSETRRGMDIMEDNFEELKSSSLYIMFRDLDDEEKETILTSLKETEHVASVDYDTTEEYNKDNNTLYIVNVEDTDDSDTSKDLYKNMQESYKEYEVYFGGSIAEANKPVLNPVVVAVAIVFAMIILILMCDSYIEPFLFLFTIGIGVFLNKGTNIFLPSVSVVTDSISAILQMALSMDYSIMLMNRYTQEKEKEKDKIKAMKKALHAAFGSISSSSVTTIVGLLALVFMSFTIGRDLGFVLAKGVLFSLISIFFVLPGLILLFDNLIAKTKKKSLNLTLNKLGGFSFKARYVATPLFIILFAVSFFLKGNLTILYTDADNDEIKKVFKETNQIAVIYNNEYEDIISKYCQDLTKEDNENIVQVLCYGNTLGDELTYHELNERLKSYSSSFNIDDELLRILYYNYYSKNSTQTIPLDTLLSFITSDIMTNDLMSKRIDETTLASIEQLSYFANSKKINANYKATELSNILGIKKNDINNLLIYYHSQNVNTSINLTNFVKFMNNDVLTDSTYSSRIDSKTRESLKQLQQFTNKEFINTPMSSKELASIFGIDEASAQSLLLLYYLNTETASTMTVQEFILTTTYLKENTNYLDGVDVSSITSLSKFAKNENNINKTPMNKAYLAQIFPQQLVEQVYTGLSLPAEQLFTPVKFIEVVLENFTPYLSETDSKQLKLLYLIMVDTQTQYNASSLATLLGQDPKSFISIYALHDYVNNNTSSWKVSPYTFVKIIVDNKENETIKASMDTNTLNKVNLLYNVMNGVIADKKYTYQELAKLVGMDASNLKLLYALYDTKYNNKTIKISLKTFINFIESDVLTNDNFKNQFSDSDKKKIHSIATIMNNTLNNKTYSSKEMYNTLNPLSSDLSKNMIDLIYTYYGSQKNYQDEWTFTAENFVNYINDDVLKDSRFSPFFNDKITLAVKNAKSKVTSSKDLLVGNNYSRMIILTTYDDEGKETFDFIQSIKDTLDSKDKEIFVIGNSPMAYDISNSFNSELNFITILTMLAIFVVVAITFKSFIVPLILVLIIQCAVYITMGILSLLGGSVYFIALLIVQSILMGATIDYAILYTSYYRESRNTMERKEAIINAYNNSIHTILTSSSILIIVTLIVGNFASAIAAKICKTISEGTCCSLLLILFILPPMLALFDKYVCKKNKR